MSNLITLKSRFGPSGKLPSNISLNTLESGLDDVNAFDPSSIPVPNDIRKFDLGEFPESSGYSRNIPGSQFVPLIQGTTPVPFEQTFPPLTRELPPYIPGKFPDVVYTGTSLRGIGDPRKRGSVHWGDVTGSPRMDIALNDMRIHAPLVIDPRFLLTQQTLQLMRPNVEGFPRIAAKLFNPGNVLASIGISFLGVRWKRSGLNLPFGESYSDWQLFKKAEYTAISTQASSFVVSNNRLLQMFNDAFGLRIRIGTPYPSRTAPGGPGAFAGVFGFTHTTRVVDTRTSQFVQKVQSLLDVFDASPQHDRKPKSTTNAVESDVPNSSLEPEDTISRRIADGYAPKDNSGFKIKSWIPYGSKKSPDGNFVEEVSKPIWEKHKEAGAISTPSYGTFRKTEYGSPTTNSPDKVNRLDFINAADVSPYRENGRPIDNLEDVYTNADSSIGRGDIIKFMFSGPNEIGKGATDIMVFRAYIQSLSENFNPAWDDVQILGRADAAHIYKSWSQDLSLSFMVVASSAEELKPMWRKLNYLATYTTPNYSGTGFFGPFMRITVGDIHKETPGYITALSYTYDMEAGWELNLNGDLAQLPRKVDVSLSFRVIHDFRPQLHGRLFSLSARGRAKGTANWLEDSSI